MISTSHQEKRPICITIVSIWLILSVLSSIAGLVTAARFVVYPDGIMSLWGAVGIFYIILILTAAVGYWRMKPWGVYSFALYIVLGLIQQLLFVLPPKLEQWMNRMEGGIITTLTILYGVVILIPGYIHIIRPKPKGNETV